MKPEHFKPFNVEHAKAGAPYGCSNGEEATVLKWDAKNDPFQLIGVRADGAGETPESWTIAGGWHFGGTTIFDLVMLPLGYIDGKPVFMGDTIISERGRLVEVRNPGFSGWDQCRWPEPEKKYPATAMSGAELCDLWSRIPDGGTEVKMTFITNAALRHACESGQVVPMADVQEVARNLAAKDRAARDQGIYAATMRFCSQVARDVTGVETGEEIERRLDNADVAAIIATVPA